MKFQAFIHYYDELVKLLENNSNDNAKIIEYYEKCLNLYNTIKQMEINDSQNYYNLNELKSSLSNFPNLRKRINPTYLLII